MNREAPSASANRRAINPWFVAIAVVVPTFMELVDTTIANVALRYIAGGLSAAVTDSEWIITSYLAANAIILPISGWISAQFGRRNYFLLSIAVFTLSSAMCGAAASLEQLIVFRVLQGLAGGGLQPSSQGVLLDSFPPEKQGAAMSVFAVAALIGPVVGPLLGGWITDTYSWRWIFFVNLPVGALAFLACFALLEDPEYLKKERAERRKRPLQFDGIGLGLLCLALVCWEVLLSKGQEWDWLGDAFGRIQILQILFVAALGGLIYREFHHTNPLINFRPLAERNFAVASLIIFCAYGVLYGTSTSLPGLLQSLFDYDATTTGLVLSPSGLFSVGILPIIAFLLGRRTDARFLIIAGLLVMGAGCYWMSLRNLEITPAEVIWPRVVTVVGLSMVFAPLNVAAFKYTPQHLRGAAVSLFSLLRNEGASVGTSMARTLVERREQFHLLRLGENLDPLNPTVNAFVAERQAFFYQYTGDPEGSRQMALQALTDLRQQQASSLAYFDVFWMMFVLAILLVLAVFLMKRSVAEKGTPSAVE